MHPWCAAWRRHGHARLGHKGLAQRCGLVVGKAELWRRGLEVGKLQGGNRSREVLCRDALAAHVLRVQLLVEQTAVRINVGSCGAEHLVQVVDEPPQPAQLRSVACATSGTQLGLLAALVAASHASSSDRVRRLSFNRLTRKRRHHKCSSAYIRFGGGVGISNDRFYSHRGRYFCLFLILRMCGLRPGSRCALPHGRWP